MKRSQAISDFIKRNRRLFIYLTIAFIFIFIVFISYNLNSLQKRAKTVNEEFGVLLGNYISDSINQMERIKSFSRGNLNFYIKNDEDIRSWIRYNELGILYRYEEMNYEFYNKYLKEKLESQKFTEIETFLFEDSADKTYLGIIYPKNGYNDFALYSVNNFLNKLPRISHFKLKTLSEKEIVLSNKNLESYNFILNNNSGFNLKKGVFLSTSNINETPYKLHLVYDLSSTVKNILLFLAIFAFFILSLFIVLFNVRYNEKHILADINFLDDVSNEIKELFAEKDIQNRDISDFVKDFKPLQKKFDPDNVYTSEMKSVTSSYSNLMNEIYQLLHKVSLQNKEISAMNKDISNSYKKLREYENKLNAFLDQISTMAPERDLEEFSQNVLELLVEIIPKADGGSIAMLEDNCYRYLAQVNYDDLLKEIDFPKELIFTTEEPEIYRNLHEKYHIGMPEKYVNVFKKIGSDKIRSSLSVGIKTDKVIGNIFIDSFEDADAFGKEDKKVIKAISRVLSTYYYLKISMEKLDKSYLEMIKALVNTVEIKDKYTRGHSERVAAYSVKLGKLVNLSSKKLKLLEEAALLHDIGKIGIDESILNKKGKLTDKEYETIKKHSVFGWSLLNDVEGLQELAKIVRYHHERWDGNGYPEGLSGEEIPIESRIIAIFDAFDTILTVRSYKEAEDFKKALKEIAENSGSQFDPHLSEVFLNNVDKDWIEE
ncbi:MAG: HD domain-containing phosphohydrolase [Bacillota bacterium]